MRTVLIFMIVFSLAMPAGMAMAQGGMMRHRRAYDQQDSYDEAQVQAMQKRYREFTEQLRPLLQRFR